MSTPTPTGELVQTADGHDLVLTRVLPGSLEESWAAISDPELTARWFGRWEGDGAVGATIRVKLGFEDESPWVQMKILDCAKPHHLRLLSVDDMGGTAWDTALELAEASEGTDLRFIMRGIDPAGIGDIGPGWEYYLDQLVASTTSGPMPDFTDYFPAQREYYEALAR